MVVRNSNATKFHLSGFTLTSLWINHQKGRDSDHLDSQDKLVQVWLRMPILRIAHWTTVRRDGMR